MHLFTEQAFFFPAEVKIIFETSNKEATYRKMKKNQAKESVHVLILFLSKIFAVE